MKKIFCLLLIVIGMSFAYTEGYTVYPQLECDDFIVNTGMTAPAGTFTAGTFGTTLNYNVVTSSVTVSTGNINIPIKVNGITYYLKAHTGI